MQAIKRKCDVFISTGDLPLEQGRSITRTIEDERGKIRVANETAGADDEAEAGTGTADRLSLDEIKATLDKRVEMMRSWCAEGKVSDQARAYEYIVQCLEGGNYLRLMVQAWSAQTALHVCVCHVLPAGTALVMAATPLA